MDNQPDPDYLLELSLILQDILQELSFYSYIALLSFDPVVLSQDCPLCTLLCFFVFVFSPAPW